MGRRKIDISKIEDDKSRHTTFYKRRAGLIKKAAELAMLCDLRLFLIFDDPSGNLIKYQSHSTSHLLQHFSQSNIKHQVHSFNSEDYPVFSTKKKAKSAQQQQAKAHNTLSQVETLEKELNAFLGATTATVTSALKKRRLPLDLRPRLQVRIPENSPVIEEQMKTLKALNQMDAPTISINNQSVQDSSVNGDDELSPTPSIEITQMDESSGVNEPQDDTKKEEENKNDVMKMKEEQLRTPQILLNFPENIGKIEKNLLASSAGRFSDLQALLSNSGFISRDQTLQLRNVFQFGLPHAFMLNIATDEDPFFLS